MAALISKPGITRLAVSSGVPKEWSQSWFRDFISDHVKGADVRNATSPRGTISIGGNLTTPYGTLDVSQTANLTINTLTVNGLATFNAGVQLNNTGLSVGQGAPPANGVVNASGYLENGIPSGTCTSSSSAAINTVETYVAVPLSIPANSLFPSSMFRIRAWGTCTNTASVLQNFNLRFGPNGTTADANIGGLPINSGSTNGTNVPFHWDADIVVRTIGSSGTMQIQSVLLNAAANSGASSGTTQVGPFNGGNPTVNTTVANKLGLSYVTAAATCTTTFVMVWIQRIV